MGWYRWLVAATVALCITCTILSITERNESGTLGWFTASLLAGAALIRNLMEKDDEKDS